VTAGSWCGASVTAVALLLFGVVLCRMCLETGGGTGYLVLSSVKRGVGGKLV
jgi:hypothetical protein